MTVRFRVSLFAMAMLGMVQTIVAAAEEYRRPNIIILFADDLGWGDLSSHGHPHIQTPHLDRLASQGTDFHQFTVGNPVCSPSRTALMTGLFPSRLGVHQHFATHASNVERNMPDWLTPDAPLLTRSLQQAGYATAHYGKWHLTSHSVPDAPSPTEYGIDDAATYTGGDRHVFTDTPYAEMTSSSAAHDMHAASFLSVAATDHTVRFIRDHQASPFFVNLWLHETHALVTATDAEKSDYLHIDEPERTYYAAVTRADREVGRVLSLLDELSLADNTIVIFSSDNGPENANDRVGHKLYPSRGSTGGLRGRKRSLLMGGVNVPFLVRWPGVVPAGRIDTQTPLAAVDMLPTLLAAANVPVPNVQVGGVTKLDGENALPALRGEPFERAAPLFWFWQGHHGGDDWPAWAVRDGQWTLVQDERRQRTELYDVVHDRQQAHDVAAQHPELVARMSAAITRWKSSLPTDIIAGTRSQSITGKMPARNRPNRSRPPKGSSSLTEVRRKAFTRKDRDHDNRMTLEEYLHQVADRADFASRFERFDRDQDGYVTKEEYIPQADAE